MLTRLGSYRKDLQWFNALICINLLMAAFVTGGAARLFTPEIAMPALAGLYKDTLLQSEWAKNFVQTKLWIQSRPSAEQLNLQYVPKGVLTAGEAAKLDVNGLATKISQQVAVQIYSGQISSFSQQDKQNFGFMTSVNHATYESLKKAASGIWLAADVFLLVTFLFGRRYGRLFSLGLIIWTATLLPLLAFQFSLEIFDSPQENPQYQNSIAPLLVLKPALLAGQEQVLKYASLAFMLMIASFIGRCVHWLLSHNQNSENMEAAAGDFDQSEGIRQTRIVELAMPYEKVFDLCVESVSSIKGTIKEENRTEGKIYAKRTMAWGGFIDLLLRPKSFGELIQFKLQSKEDDKTLIKISSKPLIPTAIFDNGQNRDNVENVKNYLLTRL